MAYGYSDFDAAIAGWYSEVEDFQYGTGTTNGNAVGHYTQVIIAFFIKLTFQPVLHDWGNKGRGMCYPVCGMVHIKEPLVLIGKSSLCGGSGFRF